MYLSRRILGPFGGLIFLFVGVAGIAAQTSPTWTQLWRLDQLPRVEAIGVPGCVSSYDRTGGNDDGFSGKYSVVRKDAEGLVMADLKGPGVITRFATPTPNDDVIEFYFDDETTPRISAPYRELFSGKVAGFPAPLVGVGSGGFWSYVPIPYQRRCRIVSRAAQIQFVQINYLSLPEGAAVASFDPRDRGDLKSTIDAAAALFSRAGTNVSALAAGSPVKTVRTKTPLSSEKPSVLFEQKSGGRIAGLRIHPASALAGKARAVLLRITFDGESEPAVLCPAGDFFGFSWGQPAAHSLLVGTADDTAYAYFPMPFERGVRVELVSENSSGPALTIDAEIDVAEPSLRSDEGRFHAVWHREAPTTVGVPFTFLSEKGEGKLVGVTLQAQGSEPGSTRFFEGDDATTVDGEIVVRGTGSEDFFNGGWYDVPGRWSKRASYPLTGCLDYVRAAGRSGGYRLFLADAPVFRRSLTQTIEHGPEGNDIAGDYVGVSYFYLKSRRVATSVPDLAQRQVVDPPKLVFVPGWYQPSLTFSIEKAEVSKGAEVIDGKDFRWLAVKAEGQDMFGPHHLSFACEVPETGKYRLEMQLLTGPDQGRIQLCDDQGPAGMVANGRSPERKPGSSVTLGEVALNAGNNALFFEIAPGASGETSTRIQILQFTLTPVR